MKEVTKILVSNLKIMKFGYDLMGYDINSEECIDFHHLLIPKKNFPLVDSNGVIHRDGVEDWNGAPLNGDTSHPYLHLIERYDFNIFIDITSEMIDQKIKGRMDPKNIRLIDMRLKDFEEEWDGETSLKGEPLIKDAYRKRLGRVR